MQAQELLMDRRQIPSDLQEFFEPAGCGACYLCHTVEILREIRRVLRKDGVCFWNVGDSYASQPGNGRIEGGIPHYSGSPRGMAGLKPKDLCLIPDRVRIAAQADGWWVRSKIIWHKPNPMPESVRDRPTDAYEDIIMLTKSARYFWDSEGVAEPATGANEHDLTSQGCSALRQTPHGGNRGRGGENAFRGQGHFRNGKGPANRDGREMRGVGAGATRNLRNVWTFSTKPFSGAHFAVFPEELPRRCIKAASLPLGAYEPDDIILTPTGEGEREHDPSMETGRAGFNRPRRVTEGVRPMSRAEQAKYAEQLKDSRHRAEMESEAGGPTTFAHYTRTDRNGARAIPPDLLDRWTERGWLRRVEIPPKKADMSRSTVLDPFAGSGTTGRVAIELGRRAVLLDLAYRGDKGYQHLASKRLENIQPQLI